MTLLQVKYFLTVVNCNSISKAVDELFVSRTAVSRVLRELEEEFGVPLLNRTASGVSLTAPGELVYHTFSEIEKKNTLLVRHMDRLRETIVRRTNLTVKLCVTPLTVIQLLPRLKQSARKRYPDLEIVAIEADHLQAQDMLADGTLDFWLTTYGNSYKTQPDLDGLTFFERELSIAMHADHPLARMKYLITDDLRDEPIVVIRQHRAFQSVMERIFEAQEFRPNIVASTFQLSTARELVRQGLACTLMPEGALDEPGRIVSVPLRPRMIWDTALVWNKTQPHNAAFQAFLEVARDDCAAWGKGDAPL